MTTTPAPSATSADPLVERYVEAVASRLPADQRTDVADELRASILDSVEDRLDREPEPHLERERVVRGVLTEMGDPARLAESYRGGPRHLVGPEHYETWRGLVVAITLAAAPITALVTLVVRIWAEDPYAEAILGSIWTGLTVAIHVAFWVTLTFWIIERTGTELDLDQEEWTVDRLPPLREPRTLGLKELIGGVGFVVIVLAWLPWQHFRSPVDDVAGDRVPILDPTLWSSGWLWGLVALLGAEIAVEVHKFRVGRWTRAVTALVVLTNAAFAVLVVAMVSDHQLVSDGLLGRASDPAAVDTAVDRIVVAVAVVTSAWGAWEAVAGHRKDRGNRALS